MQDTKLTISQSMIKDWCKLSQGEMCPRSFFKRHIDKIYGTAEPGSAMHLGTYFEYLLTGNIPKSGKAPEPELLKTGKPSAKYRTVEENVELCKATLDHYGFKINKTGLYLKGDGIGGELDALGSRDGRPCIIDFKYSGLLNNKWEPSGWEQMEYKFAHKIQACHYTELVRQNYNAPDLDFYYVVFSSTKPEGKIFKINLTDEDMAQHMNMIDACREFVESFQDREQTAPNFKECAACHLECSARQLFPDLVEVEYE